MAFVHRLRVQFFEVDLQGVVFNMWYLAWFDTAMTAYLAELGFPYGAMQQTGWDVQLVHTELDWRGGARFDEEVGVEVSTDRVGTTSFTLAFRVLRDGEEIVTARTVYVVVGVDGSGKRPVPDELREALTRPG
ncbi:MAG TPA: thioesterase family protein [Mycobacteriales bacterium]|nr:thioesterase family protein [Mycobacteriales bacterium]